MHSKSLSNLESIISPMAERIDSMFHTTGNMDEQLDEVHRLVRDLTIANADAKTPPIPTRNPARSPPLRALSLPSPSLTPPSIPESPIRRQNTRISLPRVPQLPKATEQPPFPSPTITIATPKSPTDTQHVSRTSSPTRKRVSEFSFTGSSVRYSSSSHASSEGASSVGWPPSPGTLKESSLSRQHSSSTKKTSPLPRTPEVREHHYHMDDEALSLLPPPAMGLATPYELDRVTSHTSQAKLSPYPSTQPEIMKLHRSSTTASQKAAFEKEAFRNAAILCDM